MADFIKSDEIKVDTSKAPWMEFAKAELGKKIRELAADDAFITSLRGALALDARMREAERTLAGLGQGGPLLGGKAGAMDPSRYSLGARPLRDPMPGVLGGMEASRLDQRNPEIGKYFSGVKSDPIYDKKGRSYDIAPTYVSADRGRITAWCAAFVDWCLKQADAPHLGYATAKSWLDFGTPVAHPVYGCITVIKPSSSTGSTTGHVGFFVESRGSNVVLLGGNQGDAVTEDRFKQSTVLGHRWPTRINQYLLADRAGVAA